MRNFPYNALVLLVFHAIAGRFALADWPCWRGDPALDAHVAAKGNIVTPAIAWSIFVGQMDGFAVVTPAGGDSDAVLPAAETGSLDPSADPKWGGVAPSALYEGSEKPCQNSTHITYADVRTDIPGLEKIEFESGFSLPTVNGQWQPARGRCFAWVDGAWSLLWETEPLPMVFHSMPIAGDFDADGALEIAFLPWYELVILDAATGKIKDRCRFTEGRSYGYFGVHDLDGDGKSEFVVEADFSKHVDVLGYREGKLSVLWQEAIETDISNPQKILHVNPNPVADLDGDGRNEVLVSLFNGDGNGRWHLVAHDGISGVVKADVTDVYLEGVFDVEGDGVSDVLVTRATGAGVSTTGGAAVYRFHDGKPVVAWEAPGMGWQTWSPPLPLNVSTGATFGARTVLCRTIDGHAWAALRKSEDGLALAEWTPEGFQTRCDVCGARLEALGISAEGGMLLRASYTPEEKTALHAVRGSLQALGARRAGIPAASPVTATMPDGSCAMVVQGSEDTLVMLRAEDLSRAPVEMRRIQGRSMATAWPAAMAPVLATNFAATSDPVSLYAKASPDGYARLVAEGVERGIVWFHDFPGIPGGPPVWNVGGLLLWQTGHFTSANHEDVLVTVRRSMMHSEETYLLSGLDGSEVWHRDREVSSRGVGGIPFAIADFNGDGLDDAASFHPSIVYILDGRDGHDLMARDATWDAVPSKPVYWGRPVAVRTAAAGPAVIFMAGAAMTGLVRGDGSLAWWDALDKSGKEFAFGDFDGDGQQETIGAGYEDGLRCYGLVDGKLKWSLEAVFAKDCSGAASADLDGDGRDEAVFSCGAVAYCVGVSKDTGHGEVRWRLEFPAVIGPPAVVGCRDAVGVLAACVDGRLYCAK